MYCNKIKKDKMAIMFFSGMHHEECIAET